MKTRTLLPVGTWNGGSARTLPLMAALRRAESRGQGCLLPTPDGHMGGDFQRGCKQNLTCFGTQDYGFEILKGMNGWTDAAFLRT